MDNVPNSVTIPTNNHNRELFLIVSPSPERRTAWFRLESTSAHSLGQSSMISEPSNALPTLDRLSRDAYEVGLYDKNGMPKDGKFHKTGLLWKYNSDNYVFVGP